MKQNGARFTKCPIVFRLKGIVKMLTKIQLKTFDLWLSHCQQLPKIEEINILSVFENYRDVSKVVAYINEEQVKSQHTFSLFHFCLTHKYKQKYQPTFMSELHSVSDVSNFFADLDKNQAFIYSLNS